MAQAKASGLQVSFGSMNVGNDARVLFSMDVAPDEESAIAAVDGDDGNRMMALLAKGKITEERALFDEEAAYQKAMMSTMMMITTTGGQDGLLDECESDSDDDIL